jgi:GGDEF domain-containing protein
VRPFGLSTWRHRARYSALALAGLRLELESLEALGIAVIVTDGDKRVKILNSVAEQLTGWSAREATGKQLDVIFSLSSETDEHGPLSLGAAPFRGGDTHELDAHLVNRRGQRRAIAVSVERSPSEMVVLAQDVTEQRLNALRLLHLSAHDPLTGLLNRSRFIQNLEQALRDAEKGREAAVIYIDIDRFRLVNDAAGLDAGDGLLSWVAALLREGIGREDVCARLAGNEFAVGARRRANARRAHGGRSPSASERIPLRLAR